MRSGGLFSLFVWSLVPTRRIMIPGHFHQCDFGKKGPTQMRLRQFLCCITVFKANWNFWTKDSCVSVRTNLIIIYFSFFATIIQRLNVEILLRLLQVRCWITVSVPISLQYAIFRLRNFSHVQSVRKNDCLVSALLYVLIAYRTFIVASFWSWQTWSIPLTLLFCTCKEDTL